MNTEENTYGFVYVSPKGDLIVSTKSLSSVTMSIETIRTSIKNYINETK